MQKKMAQRGVFAWQNHFLYLAIGIPVPLEGVVIHRVPIGVELDLTVLGADGKRSD